MSIWQASQAQWSAVAPPLNTLWINPPSNEMNFSTADNDPIPIWIACQIRYFDSKIISSVCEGFGGYGFFEGFGACFDDEIGCIRFHEVVECGDAFHITYLHHHLQCLRNIVPSKFSTLQYEK